MVAKPKRGSNYSTAKPGHWGLKQASTDKRDNERRCDQSVDTGNDDTEIETAHDALRPELDPLVGHRTFLVQLSHPRHHARTGIPFRGKMSKNAPWSRADL